MSSKSTRDRQEELRSEFLAATSLHELCGLLRTDTRRLRLTLKDPKYKTFNVPKKDGGVRKIEAPGPHLKRLQSNLNRYLQAVYYFEKSRAAYGFVLNVRNDEDRRNVVANARKHVGRDYLINLDLADFFHQVKTGRVRDLFAAEPFSFERDIPATLTRLVTFRGRLPMGAPTSPVLSNLAARDLDERLMQLATARDWVYTRYADDLSFSANAEFSAGDLLDIRGVIRAAEFTVNERKWSTYGPKEPKIVTGLLVSDQVALAPDYLPRVRDEVERLRQIMHAQNHQGELHTRWVEKMKQQVRGRITFAGFVLGRRNETYIDLKNSFYAATNPPEEEFGAISWWGFPYNF